MREFSLRKVCNLQRVETTLSQFCILALIRSALFEGLNGGVANTVHG